jgi:hypothetical protein
MAARTGLKENLQEISALMGLLRSDLVELSDVSIDTARRAPVMSHMRWIADRFDTLAPGLSTEPASPVRKRAKIVQTVKTAKPTKKPARRNAPSEKAVVAGEANAAAPAPQAETTAGGPPRRDEEPRPAQADAAPTELPAANDRNKP